MPSPHGLDADRHAMLIARAWPKDSIIERWDDWEANKHLADLMKAPDAVYTCFHKVITKGIIEAYVPTQTRMAYYTTRDLDGMFRYLQSPEVAYAIEDGSQWFGQFNDVDFAIFTGNVCLVDDVFNNLNAVPPEECPLYVERFEVGPDDTDFDPWLREVHAPAYAHDPRVARVRTFHAVRENIPISYYLSPGNRMLMVDFMPGTDLRAVMVEPPMLAALEDAQRWDRRLSYVKRDLSEYVAHAYSAHGGAS